MTSPVTEVIPREIPENLLPLLKSFGDFIDEIVNFGSHVLIWETKTARGGDENVAPVMLLRHFLDLIDSISILARQSCGDTSKVLIRSALEVTFSLEYLLEKNTNDRSMDFLLIDILNQIKTINKFNPTTKEGSDLYKVLNDEFSFRDLKLEERYNFKELISDKEGLLNLPQYSKSYAEYQRIWQKGVKNPQWYSFYGGPKNFRELSIYLKQQSLYELLYRKWSGPTHGNDIYLGRMMSKEKGGVNIVQLRYVKDLQEVIEYSVALSLKVFNVFIRKRIPERINEFQSWYMSIRDIQVKLNQKKYIIVK